jgi:hypothetical protein
MSYIAIIGLPTQKRPYIKNIRSSSWITCLMIPVINVLNVFDYSVTPYLSPV